MQKRTPIDIFVSSPSDVLAERHATQRTIERLARSYSADFRIAPLLWEHQALDAGKHFQAGLRAPHETNIVVVVLWSRLGVTLPIAEFPGPISGGAVTGTEWEFEDALKANHQSGSPHLLVYKKEADVFASLGDELELEKARGQKRLVESFFRRWFLDKETGGFKAAFRSFKTTSEFEELLETHLRSLLDGQRDLKRTLPAVSRTLARAFLPQILASARVRSAGASERRSATEGEFAVLSFQLLSAESEEGVIDQHYSAINDRLSEFVIPS